MPVVRRHPGSTTCPSTMSRVSTSSADRPRSRATERTLPGASSTSSLARPSRTRRDSARTWKVVRRRTPRTTRPITGTPSHAPRRGQRSGSALQGPVREWNPLKAVSPFRSAPHAVAGARVTVLATSRWSLGANGSGVVDDGVLRGNAHRQYTGSVNGGFSRDSTLAVHSNVWVIGGRTHLPMIGSSVLGVVGAGLLGRSVDDPELHGYLNLPPAVLEEFGIDQRLYRLGGVARLEWQPRGWLSLRTLAGREDSRAQDDEFDPTVRFSQPVEVNPPRIRAVGERRSQRTTASASAAASYGGPVSRLTTDVSFDYATETNRSTAQAFDVLNPSTYLDQSWRGSEATTKGLIVRQTFSSSDRRFAEVGFRSDVLGGASHWRTRRTRLRVSRGMWGARRSSLRTAQSRRCASARRTERAAIADHMTPPSNPVQPSRCPPVQGMRFRWSARRRSRPALMSAWATDTSPRARRSSRSTLNTRSSKDRERQTPVRHSWSLRPPPSGAHTDRSGAAGAARGRTSIRRPRCAHVHRRRESGHERRRYRDDPAAGLWDRVGLSTLCVWGQDYVVIDSNKDGVITPAEVIAGPDRHFLGSPVPTFEVGLSPSVVFAHTVTVSALVDSRSGFRVVNQSGRLRCVSGLRGALRA